MAIKFRRIISVPLVIAAFVFLVGITSFSFAAPPPRALPVAIMSNMVNGQPLTSRNDFSDPSKATFGPDTTDPTGASAILRQFIQNANVHFESFNIGSEATVTVVHPSQEATTVGHIHQNDPSQLFGTLNVTTTRGGNGGEVILLNQNGFVFGPNARVGSIDTTGAIRNAPRGFIASSLDLNELAADGDLLLPISQGEATFIPFASGDSGSISTQQGAQINVSEGGRVFLVAPEVINEGRINTPLGQTLLVAGNRVFLASDEEFAQGVVAEVEVGGTVTNGTLANENLAPGALAEQLAGQIYADQGNVTLLGKTVNQLGTVSANTSIEIGGRIRLIARDGARTPNAETGQLAGANDGGSLTLGVNSITQSIPVGTAGEERADQVAQPDGVIQLFGEQIHLREFSKIIANSGRVEIVSRNSTNVSDGRPDNGLQSEQANTPFNPDSIVQIDEFAEIDVSGLNISRSESDLVLDLVSIGSRELSDTPIPENRGVIGGNEVFVENDFVADATSNIEIADLSESIEARTYDIEERNLTGGTVSIQAEGIVRLENNTRIDVSGGSVAYQLDGSRQQSTLLMQSNGAVVSIENASADEVYVGVLDPNSPFASMQNLIVQKSRGILSMEQLNAPFTENPIVQLVGRSAGEIEINSILLDLQGDLIGSVTVGDLQVLPGLNRADAESNNPQIANNFTPLGGSLTIGNALGGLGVPNYRIVNIELTNNFSGLELVNDDPSLSTVFIPTSLVDPDVGGFSEVRLFANNQINLPTNVSFDAAPETSIVLTSREALINGDISIIGGDVSINAVPTVDSNQTFVSLGRNVDIQLGGNQQSSFFQPEGIIAIDGGSFAINLSGQAQPLNIAQGAEIDVSAGYLVTIDESFVGDAGSISLENSGSSSPGEFSVDLNAFTGFGAIVPSNGNSLVGSGGTFTIDIPGDVCISSNSCGSNLSADAFQITPEFLVSSGFSSYELSTLTLNQQVNGQAQITGAGLVDDTLLLNPQTQIVALNAPTMGMTMELSTSSTLDVAPELNLQRPTNFSFDAALELTLSSQSQIVANPASNLSFSSGSRIFADGTINAPASNVAFEIANGSPNTDRAIFFGSNSLIDVSGVFIPEPNLLNLQIGDIFDAGNISAVANTGFVIAQSGSTFNAAGVVQQVDQIVLRDDGSVGDLSSSLTTLDGIALGEAGALDITAAEGILWNGSIDLRSADSQLSRNGSLAFTLDGNLRGSAAEVNPDSSDFNLDPRIIRITSSTNANIPLDLQPGDEIPEEFFGAPTIISQELIENSGAGTLGLTANDIVFTFNNPLTGVPANASVTGEIQFDPGVELGVQDQITFNTSMLSIPTNIDTSVNVAANVIQFGSNQTQERRPLPVPRTAVADTTLTFEADLIELFGDTSIADIANFELLSRGDIRLVGNTKGQNSFSLEGSPTELTGSLNLLDVFLTLQAQQIYPSTLTQFSFNNSESVEVQVQTENGTPVLDEFGRVVPILDDNLQPIVVLQDITVDGVDNPLPTLIDDGRTSVIQTRSVGGTADDVLSGAGTLAFNTTVFDHGSVALAPLGVINVNASVEANAVQPNGELEAGTFGNVNLRNGSVLSTSANDQLIPFGRVLLNQDLVYEFGAILGLFGVESVDQPLPEKAINLISEDINSSEGSVINVEGGGDLLSYAFQAGANGTVDFLEPGNSGDSFAILPLSELNYSPRDLQNEVGFNAGIGEIIELEGSLVGAGSGIQRFVKLPAIYAILPDSYLVNPVSGFEGIQVGQSFQQFDGSVISGGRTLFNNSSLANPGTTATAFKIESQSVLAQRGQYDRFLISEFAREVPNVGGSARLANDAGIVTIQANQNLNLNGTLRGTAPNGLQSQLRVTSENIAIVNSSSNINDFDGFLLIQDDQLNNFGATSVVLGAIDTRISENLSNNIISNEIVIDANSSIAVEEIILASNQNILINDNVSIESTSSSSSNSINTFDINGDAAVFISSGSNLWNVETQNPTDSPESTLQFGVSEQSVNVNADRTIFLSADAIDYNGNEISTDGTFTIRTNSINLGDSIPDDAQGTTLTANDLSQVDVNTLAFVTNSVNVYGAGSVTAENFILDTSLLEAQSNGDAAVTPSLSLNVADRFTLRGGVNNQLVSPNFGDGIFTVSAETVELSSGNTIFENFASLELTASDSVNILGDGAILTAGDITIRSNLIDLGAGSDYSISSAQSGIIVEQNGQVASESQLNEFTGRLNLQASDDIFINTFLAANSGGLVSSSTNGSVEFGDQALIDLSGVIVNLGLEQFSTAGGELSLNALEDVVIQAESVVDLRGAGNSNSGSLNIKFNIIESGVNTDDDANNDVTNNNLELAGTLLGSGATKDNGGKFDLDIYSITEQDLNTINTTLNNSGFTAGRNIRARTGDLIFGENDSIQSSNVELVADSGAISISGIIDASSVNGAEIALYANNDIDINSSALIDARSLSDSEFVDNKFILSSKEGLVNLFTDAQIDLSNSLNGSANGEIYIRVSRDSNNPNQVMIGDLSSSIVGTTGISVEAFEVTNAANIDTGLQTTLFTETNGFAGNDGANLATIETGLEALLALDSDLNVSVFPGIEIFNEGDINVNSDWDLTGWRFGDADNARPIVLTIRSTENININQSIFDGVVRESVLSGLGFETRERILEGDSASIYLVAGADQTAANFTQTQFDNIGDIILAPGIAPTVTGVSATIGDSTVVRTGNGDIGVFAAGDLVFGNQYSNIFTSGVPSVGRINENGSVDAPVLLDGLNGVLYASNAGDLTVNVGGDITGSDGDKYVNDFLHRTGNINIIDLQTFEFNPDAVGWTVDTAYFNHELGVIGGGNIDITVGGTSTNLGVALPSIGIQVGGSTFVESDVYVTGGGILNYHADGDIVGGSLLLGRGVANITTLGSYGFVDQAGDSIAAAEGTISVTARENLSVGNLYNPTLLPRSLIQANKINARTFLDRPTDSIFSTYESNSRVQLTALSGAFNSKGGVDQFIDEFGLNDDLNIILTPGVDNRRTRLGLGLRITPSSVEFVALNDRIDIATNQFLLSPSENSSLIIAARDDVTFADFVEFALPDIEANILPNVEAPVDQINFVSPIQPFSSVLGNVARIPTNDTVDFNRISATPLHGRSDENGVIDNQPSLIISDSGSIVFSQQVAVEVAEPIRVFAGRDLIDPSIIAQNNRSTDISEVIVGGEIIFETSVEENAAIFATETGIAVDGPGQFTVVTGGDVDLGTSAGLLSRGNLVNPNLPDDGGRYQFANWCPA